MKIYLGSDHAGFKLKEVLTKYLEKLGHQAIDLGPKTYDKNDDYPDYIIPVAKKVVKEKGSRGIVIGGSGQGEALAANKIKGVRAALYYGGKLQIVKLSREHNNANILSLGARFVSKGEAKKALKLWLNTPFSKATRHRRRINKIEKLK